MTVYKNLRGLCQTTSSITESVFILVKFPSVDSIYTYTNQVDIADVTKHRQRHFMLKLQTCSNLVISLLCSVVYWLFCLIFIVHICLLCLFRATIVIGELKISKNSCFFQRCLLNYVGYRMPPPNDMPDAIYNIAMRCWELEPQHRPTFDYIYNELRQLRDVVR